MKTEGLDYTEAVQSLLNKKCKEIISNLGINYFIDENTNIIATQNKYITPIASEILGKWTLTGANLRAEIRIAKYWLIIWPSGGKEIRAFEPSDATHKEAQHIFEITQPYTYTYPEDEAYLKD